ncbi:hypothetical protein M0R04_04170 [Candidatus Dojkabacteria bacterium]|jgi:hypothetical protein|nr:hypothetical protein [Candidatus Dojkabacteria bacterium]
MARQRLLDRIKEAVAKEGLIARTTIARNWIMKLIRETVKMNSSAKMGFVNLSTKSKKPQRSTLTLGKMYFYFYDPKTKEQLPYYDTFPLVIPIDYMPASRSASKKDNGFIGLNLHYIKPQDRMILLDELYTITNNDNYDETTKIRLKYKSLVKNINLIKAMPCLKWYLFKQVRSNILEVDADHWDIAALLPFSQFMKQPKEVVWTKSKERY